MYVFDLPKNCKPFLSIHTLPLSAINSGSLKNAPIFSKSLKTIIMISAEASTPHQEQVLQNSTWEFKFQMLLEFQARNYHVKVTQGNATQLLYSSVRNERQLYNKDPQSYNPPVLETVDITGISIQS
jgi:hypothetical protein